MEIYNLEQIGEKLGVTVKAVREFIKRGELRAVKRGRAYYVSDKGLTEFLEPPDKEPPPAEEPPGENFLTVTQFSEKTKIPPAKIREWLREGIIRGTKDRRGIWFVDPKMVNWWSEIRAAMNPKKKKP